MPWFRNYPLPKMRVTVHNHYRGIKGGMGGGAAVRTCPWHSTPGVADSLLSTSASIDEATTKGRCYLKVKGSGTE